MADDKKSGQDTPKPDDQKSTDQVLYGDDKKPADAKADDKKPDGEKKPEGDTKPDDKKGDDKKTDDKKPADSKTEGDKDGKAATEPEVPEKYELKRPDDELWTDDDVARLAANAKAMGLTQKQAERLLELDVQASDALRTGFLTELKADKDLGGAKFDATVAAANHGLREFLKDNPQEEQDQVIGMLARSGYSNHKALVRAFARIGRMLKEDDPDTGGKGGGGGNADKTDAEILYGRK